MATAVETLSKLHNEATHKKLEELAAQERLGEMVQTVVHDTFFFNSRDPLFWHSCFVRLFPRGDCAERCAERPTCLQSWNWAKCFLMRADTDHWRTDVEFIASLYNIFLRRDQVNAVEAYYRGQSNAGDCHDNSRGTLSKGKVQEISNSLLTDW